jgi:hypothetical protein
MAESCQAHCHRLREIEVGVNVKSVAKDEADMTVEADEALLQRRKVTHFAAYPLIDEQPERVRRLPHMLLTVR